jgi:acylphosphatase
MLIARTLLISGRVQGVGFRYFTREAAVREGLTGWVRNLADGRVRAYLEGEAEAVTRVERLLRRGPGSGHVTDVAATDEPATGAFSTFEIR